MEIRVGVGDLLKMGTKLVGHKIVQYRLATKQTKVISTRNGQLKGLRRKTLYDEELYYAFEGIPFAQPPVRELRFRAPQPAQPWQGIRDCTYPRAKPMQKHFVLSIVEGSEDCLYLNVYAKKLDTERPLPVLVWIYGGGFQIGEASRDFYSPDYFMKQDVILVTFNYRVGALGFLSLADRDLDVPGNAGLKDQVMALRWVRENISQFNGDANNITLMGESAGAASTHMMMTTEQTRGLFHKAIMQSGSMYSEWASDPRGNWAYRLACSIGYAGSENEKEVFRYLQRASAADLATHCIALITEEEKRNYVLFSFTPVVEPYVTSDCVMPKPHSEMLADAWGNDLPLIIGGNSFEGLFSYQSTMQDADYMLSAFEALIPRVVRNQVTPAELKDLIREFKISNFDDATRGRMEFNECLHLLSIKHFWHGVHRTVLSRLALAPNTPTYLYRFDFDSPHFNHFRTVMCGRHVRGVSHGDDISYLFYLLLATKLDKSSMEYRTIERMIGMWTAFAANDNPNCKQISPVLWDALDTNGPQMCLNIGHRLEFIELPEAKQLRMWDRLYDKQNNNQI
ncbi:esterase B1 [Drosophila guanche]|uniref:carboxylesterase n=1 Tax=Drosophila guanche TaxID=7266 RepID=A0A3B0JPE9_DROGU|nr:esterase B1 [Drosophila guanche]SPP84094.1 blast:Esterase B1 [Drosophila guanche]